MVEKNTYKLNFVNNGKEFELPEIKVEDEIEILDFLVENTTEKDSRQKKNLLEYSHAVYLAFKKIDDTVTEEQIRKHLTFDKLTEIYLRLRFRSAAIYTCPFCKEKFSLIQLLTEFNKNTSGNNSDFPKTKSDTTKKKETT